jgi:hypothetical protein
MLFFLFLVLTIVFAGITGYECDQKKHDRWLIATFLAFLLMLGTGIYNVSQAPQYMYIRGDGIDIVVPIRK